MQTSQNPRKPPVKGKFTSRLGNRIVIITLFMVLLGWSAFGTYRYIITQARPQDAELMDQRRLAQAVDYQVSLGPRIPGSQAHQQVVDWMVTRLKSAGWQVEVQEATAMGHPVRNVVATYGEGSPWVVVGAHFDSRLYADEDQDPANHTSPVPAANDGASGVAVLLEAARSLPRLMETKGIGRLPGDARKVTLLFIDVEDNYGIPGWEGELGSQLYVSSLSVKPDAAVIIDMIGDADLNIFEERNSDPEFTQQIWSAAKQLGYEQYFIPQPKYSMIDDHIPFLQAGIRAVDVIDFDYPYWHTLADTPDKVSGKSMAVVGETMLAWLIGDAGR